MRVTFGESFDQNMRSMKTMSTIDPTDAVPGAEFTALDLTGDPVELTKQLVDIPSVSFDEAHIADSIEVALKRIPHIECERIGNTVCARTNRGLGKRIVLAGHIDTVPIAKNVPHTMSEDGTVLYCCGAVDMKSGLAVYLHAFATLANSSDLGTDLTLLAYEAEEVSSEHNGLKKLADNHSSWLEGDLALLGEPSGGIIEAGCQGSLRIAVTAHGQRAHSARAWLGENAAHRLSSVVARVAQYEPRSVFIDGLEYREGMNIVHLESGIATNVIPDEAWMFINFRFAPNRSEEEALKHLLDVIGMADQTEGDIVDNLSYRVDDSAGGALPGLQQPAAQPLLDAMGGKVRAKFGWTDVARFNSLGVPAVNFGPGDPGFAHKIDEQCPVADITAVSESLKQFLTS